MANLFHLILYNKSNSGPHIRRPVWIAHLKLTSALCQLFPSLSHRQLYLDLVLDSRSTCLYWAPNNIRPQPVLWSFTASSRQLVLSAPSPVDQLYSPLQSRGHQSAKPSNSQLFSQVASRLPNLHPMLCGILSSSIPYRIWGSLFGKDLGQQSKQN